MSYLQTLPNAGIQISGERLETCQTGAVPVDGGQEQFNAALIFNFQLKHFSLHKPLPVVKDCRKQYNTEVIKASLQLGPTTIMVQFCLELPYKYSKS